MNTHDDFLQWLLSASLRASVLAIAVLGLQISLGRWLPARWRHGMWLPVVLVLLAPMLPESRFSMENGFREKPVTVEVAPVSLPAPQSFVETGTMVMPESEAKPAVSWQPDVRQLLFGAWLLGVCGVLVAGGVGYRRSLRRIARGTVAASPEVIESVARVAQQLGVKRVPRVILSSEVDSPAVAGFLRPVLLLPAEFPAGFSANEARMVLLHELTHLKRHDLPLNWLLCALQALHWFNPLLWLAFARMRGDREKACDAQVLGVGSEDCRADYGHALLKLQSPVSRAGLGLAFVGIFGRAGMRSRIHAIATHRRHHPMWGLAAALMIATLILVGATRAQDARIDQKDKAGWGAFVSFKDGTLALKGQAGELIWNNITEPTRAFHWDTAARDYKPASPAEVLSKVEAGTWIFVGENKTHIRVGAAKEGHVRGTFVSSKEDKMLLLGKDLPASNFTKKYGNQLNFPKFAENVPVFESIDGGEYTLAGTPAATLPKIKEGTLVTVYFGPSDGFFTRIEIGVKKEPAADKAGKETPAASTDQKDKSGYGKFVSFKDGTLTLKGNYSGLIWNNIPEKSDVVHWDDTAGKYVPSGTAEVLSKVEAGTWIIVGSNRALIRVGARKGSTTGTFVSFKNDRLLMLGKDLGPAYTKKYGNQLHMNKFADDVPVYESIDGGDFVFAGHPAKVLPTVKEGAIITVHGAGDDNITRIDLGVPKK